MRLFLPAVWAMFPARRLKRQSTMNNCKDYHKMEQTSAIQEMILFKK